MAGRKPLSKGELDVARVVWDLGEATVAEVFEQFTNDKDIDYSTLHTFLRRLEAKGYLRTRRDGRNKIYSPRVRPSQVIRETVDEMTDRLFDGEAFALVQHLVRDQGLSQEDLRKLRALLEELS